MAQFMPQRPFRSLQRWVHGPVVGTPYFDEELQVPQSPSHREMVGETVPILNAIALDAGLGFFSDEPIWYLSPETDEQKTYYGDLVLARDVDRSRVTAEDLLLVIEVVSTNDRRKIVKDTRFQLALNEYNGVPEFGLVFPDLDDPRALTWCRLRDGRYEEQVVVPGGRVTSETVPGLDLLVLPRERWARGHKIDFYYRGELRPRLLVERARAEEAIARAEQETARAEQEAARAEQEAARAEQETARAEREATRAEQQAARAEQEAARAEQEAARAERLAQRLRELGLEPDEG